MAEECWMLSKYNVHCERPWPLWAWGSAHFVWISRRPLCTTESKLALGWRPPHNQSQHRHFRWPHDYWGASLKVHKGHPAEYPLFQPEKKIKFSIFKWWRFNFSCNSFILRISNLLYKMEHLLNFKSIEIFKVWLLRKGHKIWINLPTFLWCYLLASKKKWKIVSNFVTF